MFKRLPVPFIFILAAGFVLGSLMVLETVIPYLYWGELEEFVWHRSALPHFINYMFWPFLVPWIYVVSSRYQIGKGASMSDRLATVFFSLLIPFAHEFFTTLIYFSLLASLNIFYFQPDTWELIQAAFPGVFIGRIVEFWIIYGLFAAFDYYKKYKDKQAELGRIEAQLNRTKLEVLKMQLQPHFLFNALNTISSLMDIDVKKAQQVTARLGDLLRGILEHDSRVFVTLEEELGYVRTYLEIEHVRFEDRLSYRFEIEEGISGHQVPLLIVQTLVENAIKHGVAMVSRPVTILVKAFREGSVLVVQVKDDGKGCDAEQVDVFSKGIVLQNTRGRLKEQYKGQASMKVDCQPGKGFEVILRIPKQPLL